MWKYRQITLLQINNGTQHECWGVTRLQIDLGELFSKTHRVISQVFDQWNIVQCYPVGAWKWGGWGHIYQGKNESIIGLLQIRIALQPHIKMNHVHYHLEVQANPKNRNKKTDAIFSIYGRNGIIPRHLF